MDKPTEKSKDEKEKKPAEPQSSTTRELSIYHSDDEDVFIVRIDAKDPLRQKVMGAIQSALESAQPPRNEEASKAKAYAAEKLPDDWRRKSVTSDPDATPAFRQPGDRSQTGQTSHAQQHDTDKDRGVGRHREEETRTKDRQG